MKLTIDQIKQALADAPEGATNVEHTGVSVTVYLMMPSGNEKATLFSDTGWTPANQRQLGMCWPIHSLSDLRTILEQHERIEALEKKLSKSKADAFYEVGSILKYEYEGPYDQSGIEEFFDGKATELLEGKQ